MTRILLALFVLAAIPVDADAKSSKRVVVKTSTFAGNSYTTFSNSRRHCHSSSFSGTRTTVCH